MAKFTGRQTKLGAAREATRGTAVAPTYWIPFDNMTFEDKVIKARSVAGIGVLADSEEAFVTTRFSEGSVEGEIRDKSFGLFLYSMLGTLSTAGPTDSAYTHSFSLSDSVQHQSLAFSIVDANNSEVYKNVMLSSLEVIVELDNIVKYNATFVSKKGNVWTAQVPAYVAEDKFTKKHLSFKVADEVANLTAATAVSLKSLRLTFNQNAEIDDVLGTADPEDILNKTFSVEGAIDLNYEDATWKDYFTAGTNRSAEIKLTNTDATIGAGAINPSLTIRMPKVDFFEWAPDYSLDGVVMQTLSFKASHDLANSLSVVSTCDLVNGVTSY